ncbi:MAG: hypothetical protein ABFS86_10750 [Planctomycetota bacterium]
MNRITGKSTIGTIIVVLALAVFAGRALGADEFSYRDGPTGGNLGTILYYEVKEDYSVDLNVKFSDPDKLPGGVGGPNGKWLLRPLGWKGTDMEKVLLRTHVAILSTREIRWDFIELVKGVLTVKKGYRWDGASTIGNDWNINDNKPVYLRGSCMHDAMYDLMRMGYLAHDTKGNDDWSDDGFKNRLTADCLMHMLFKEDGEDTLINEFKFVRYGGAEKTQMMATNMGGKLLLAPWKYYVSRLGAWMSEDGVELKFLDADAADKDPLHYGMMPHEYRVLRWTEMPGVPETVGEIQDWLPMPDSGFFEPTMSSYITDPTVEAGRTYFYLVVSTTDESGRDWDDRRHDQSDLVEITVPADWNQEPPPPPPPPAEVFAGDGSLYVAKGAFVVDWSKHAKGQSSDSLTLIGCVSPAGMAADLSGATIDVKVGGESLVGPIVLDGSGKAKSPKAWRVSLSPKTGRFVVKIVGLDLRTLLDVKDVAGAAICVAEFAVEFEGTDLVTAGWAGVLEFAGRTKAAKKTVGKFSFRKNETFTGAFVPMGVKVKERDGLCSLSMKGPFRGHGGGPLAPVEGAAAITITIGDADPIEVPYDALEIDGGDIGLTKGAVPELAKFAIDDGKKSLVLQTDGLEGIGLPPAGEGETTAVIVVRIVVEEADGPRIFKATIEVKRSSTGSAK